jgi:hypothetical protein
LGFDRERGRDRRQMLDIYEDRKAEMRRSRGEVLEGLYTRQKAF